MKRLLCCIVMMLLLNDLSAQTSIGFRDTKNIQPILDYRLPSWGYQHLKLDMSSRGEGQYTNQDQEKLYQNINLYPEYHFYRESENLIKQLKVILNSSFYYEFDKNQTGYGNQRKHKRMEFDCDFYSEGKFNKYISQNIFFNFEGGLECQYFEFRSDYWQVLTAEPYGSHNISVNPRLILGIGIGRIRNVTPLIQSLRLNERLAALGRYNEMSADQIQSAANVIAKYAGYEAANDRFIKNYYKDLFHAMGVFTEPIGPFEYEYIKETFSEVNQARYQGWDVLLNVGFDYRYFKSPNLKTKGSFSTLTAKLRYYQNPRLSHQIGTEIEMTYLMSLDKPAAKYSDLIFCLSLHHTWIIHDRFCLSSNFYMNEKIVQSDDDYYSKYPTYDTTVGTYQLGSYSSLYISNYGEYDKCYWISVEPRCYIEDYFYLYNIIGIAYVESRDSNSLFDVISTWFYRIGLTYYFSRGLVQ